jgi:hypothetical protein
VVSERLGHATVSTTLDIYSHAIPALQQEAAALIAWLVFAPGGQAANSVHVTMPGRSVERQTRAANSAESRRA